MACVNVCQRDAIMIQVDKKGYEYPVIDENRCIHCNQCAVICQRRHTVKRNIPKQGYAAQLRNTKDTKKSASGGVVQGIAREILERGGVCYGCTLKKDENGFFAEHIKVERIQELDKILNTKYIISRIGTCYRQVKKDLEAKKEVLFSGTPCQVQGLKAYLEKDYDNLLTVDVICHGVPSASLFNAYIRSIEELDKICVTNYIFRDKSISWGLNYCIHYYRVGDKRKKKKIVHYPKELSSFTIHYLNKEIFREKCYTCELANIHRVSDLTCGDFWSIEKEYPELILTSEDRMKLSQGISCVLSNTNNGNNFIKRLEKRLILKSVEIEAIARNNENLNYASKKGKNREEVLKIFEEIGYMEIEKTYRRKLGWKKYIYRCKNFVKKYMPDRLRIFLYKKLF